MVGYSYWLADCHKGGGEAARLCRVGRREPAPILRVVFVLVLRRPRRGRARLNHPENAAPRDGGRLLLELDLRQLRGHRPGAADHREGRGRLALRRRPLAAALRSGADSLWGPRGVWRRRRRRRAVRRVRLRACARAASGWSTTGFVLRRPSRPAAGSPRPTARRRLRVEEAILRCRSRRCSTPSTSPLARARRARAVDDRVRLARPSRPSAPGRRRVRRATARGLLLGRRSSRCGASCRSRRPSTSCISIPTHAPEPRRRPRAARPRRTPRARHERRRIVSSSSSSQFWRHVARRRIAAVLRFFLTDDDVVQASEHMCGGSACQREHSESTLSTFGERFGASSLDLDSSRENRPRFRFDKSRKGRNSTCACFNSQP